MTWTLMIATVGCAARTIDDANATQGGDGDDDPSADEGSTSEGPGADDADLPQTSGNGGDDGDDGSASATTTAGGDDGRVCEPGTAVECTCDDRLYGWAECAPGGQGYLDCTCPVPPGIPDPDCDNVLICPDCQFCASNNGCSEQYAACMVAPGCNDFRLCAEQCDGDMDCFLDCANGLDAQTAVIALDWLECTVGVCPVSCGG